MPPPQQLYGLLLASIGLLLLFASQSLESSRAERTGGVAQSHEPTYSREEEFSHQLHENQVGADEQHHTAALAAAQRQGTAVRRLVLHPGEVEKQERWCRAVSSKGSEVKDLKAAYDQNVAAKAHSTHSATERLLHHRHIPPALALSLACMYVADRLHRSPAAILNQVHRRWW
jgi:hypothetical protein